MPIYYGTDEINTEFFGTNEISEIYVDNNLVWTNAKTIALGEGTSFDIKSITDKYASLTADNFFALSATTAQGSTMVDMSATATERQFSGFTAKLVKSYNASTGQLSFYNGIFDGTRLLKSEKVKAVMVINVSKLIDLGTAQSFNLTSYSNYRNFTNDNFLILSSTSPGFSVSFYPQGYMYRCYGTGQSIIGKSYNSSTGVLSAYVRQYSWETDGTYTYYNANNYGGVRVFLIEKL